MYEKGEENAEILSGEHIAESILPGNLSMGPLLPYTLSLDLLPVFTSAVKSFMAAGG
jgi:hypothetical protein